MHVSTKARYAVSALADLAHLSSHKNTAPIALKEIAQRQELPLPYMEQIFAKLRRANLVRSMRGAQGGYTLARAPEDVPVSAIIYAVDGPVKTTRCSGIDTSGCMQDGGRCLTHHLWADLGRSIHDYLQYTTLHDVLNKTSFYKARNEQHGIGHVSGL